MNPMDKIFSNGKAFIPFITAGDPCLSFTEELILEMAAAGADLIEIGIPFSDPIAEGPVIQAANIRALSNGVTTDQIFEMVRRVRKTCNVPLAFMTYANPVFSYGIGTFLKNCKTAGINALIIPDVPFEEHEEFKPLCKEFDISFISMIAPTSENRIKTIAESSEGFIYCVSSLGVTGMRNEINGHVEDMVKSVKEVKDIPCALGFGISNPMQAREKAQYFDGIIVGSAIVNIIADHGLDSIPRVKAFVKEMKAAINSLSL